VRFPYQRVAIYIVISMPNRRSIACGVSQTISILLSFADRRHLAAGITSEVASVASCRASPAHNGRRQGKVESVRHESHLMIFMSLAGVARSSTGEPRLDAAAFLVQTLRNSLIFLTLSSFR